MTPMTPTTSAPSALSNASWSRKPSHLSWDRHIWQTISGKTYYFTKSGSMAYSEWYGGYWLNADGTWTYPYKGSWRQGDYGLRFEDTSGWYAKNQSVWINGKKYQFDANGYLVE